MRSSVETLSGSHGAYELLERITRGGMADVFRAVRCGAEGFERAVAIKRIRPELAGDRLFVSMFLDEAKIAAQLTHPNIVQTLDLGIADGEYFIALEYIDGIDLRAVLKRCRLRGAKFPRWHACRIVAEVCAALSYAHNKTVAGRPLNIVHRDVSPPNVLVSRSGEVKLIDFGVAKAARRRAWTADGTVKGKVPYLAPEQVVGRESDHRSDIFAAGILLWELLANASLFRARSKYATLQSIYQCEPAPPSSKNPTVPAELDDIVAKALARDPDDRYQDAGQLQDRLCEYMRSSGELSSARGLATWVERVRSDDPTDRRPPTRMMRPRSRSAKRFVQTNLHIIRRSDPGP